MIYTDDNVFHLTDGAFSYAFRIKDGKPTHTYYGKALKRNSRMLAECEDAGADWAAVECGERGRGDFRIPSLALCGNGFASTDLKYVGHEITEKPELGMPALRGAVETLVVTLRDDVAKVELKLFYSVYDGALARHAELINLGDAPVTLSTADSACVDFGGGDYEYISLDGRWGGECGVTRGAVLPGVHTLGSARGITSHQHNPFVAVLRRGAGEEHGEAYGFNLVYSGGFGVRLERDEKSQVRVCIGAELYGGVTLAPRERFVTPEAVCVYSDSGIGGMSRKFHTLYRKHLINPRFADKPRPVVINSWESMYFDFDEQKLKSFIGGATGLGIDTVVLDDGWFGRRDRDDSSLGDWTVDARKLPNGLKPVIDCCKANGMKFGIWFEPEAISPDSELYRAHPEFALATRGRTGVQMRNQFVLDFSRRDVVDFIYEAMRKILSEYDISYVKWDMNRPLSDVDDAKKYIGYVKGVYSLYERITATFPHILIEGCCSGGGRLDPAILYYSPMIWSSDDSDAHERTKIQYGLSLCYPLQTLSNHVSVCPNHQTGRHTPLATRGAVASLGCLGYELNAAALGVDERAQIKAQAEAYKVDAPLILTGELYRLRSPFEDGAFCEQVTAADGSAAYVVYVVGLGQCNMPVRKLRLCGLDADARYAIAERDGAVYGGAELMYGGIRPKISGDFGAEILHITRVADGGA